MRNGRRTFDYGVPQQARPDPASAEEACRRQHAVAGSQRAGAASGQAVERARADLLARHDGRADRHRFRPRFDRRTLRRKAFRQDGARLAAPGSRGRRRRTVHGRHHRAELEQGAQHPAAAVRQPRDAVLPPEHGRYRRTARQEMGTPQPRRGNRRRAGHDGADAGYDRAVRLRLSLQFVLPARLSSFRRRAGAFARDHHDDARHSAGRPVDAEASQDARRGRHLHEQDGRRDHRRAPRRC